MKKMLIICFFLLFAGCGGYYYPEDTASAYQRRQLNYQRQQLYELNDLNRNLENLWIQQQNQHQQGGLMIAPPPAYVPYRY